MPLYEYHCETCRKTFEKFQSLSRSEAPQPCPACGAEAPRVLSGFAVKGGGALGGGGGFAPSAGPACGGGGG